MKVNIQCVQCTVEAALLDHTQNKLNKLGEKYDWIIEAEVFFKDEKDAHNQGKVAEVKLSVPGPAIFAKGHGELFEIAAKEALEGIRRQLRKYKTKHYASQH